MVHYTVQEFFEGSGSDRLSGVQIKLSNACIVYLSLRAFGAGTCLFSRELRERLENFPFYDYVSRYWGFHAKCQKDHAEIRRFLSQGEHMAASSQALVRDFYLEEGQPTLWTALHFVAYFGLDDFLQSVSLQCAVDSIDYRQRTALILASKHGHEDVVRLLLDNDAQIDIVDEDGRTALLYTSGNGHEAVVRILPDKGAPVSITDKYGRTTLLYASGNGHEAVVRLLLGTGAQVDITAENGQKALLYASGNGYEDVVRLLLDKDAQVDIADKYGRNSTPLCIREWLRGCCSPASR